MKSRFALAAGLLAVALYMGLTSLPQPARAVELPAPAQDAPRTGGSQSIVLAGGCFWGMQAVFQHTKGVTQAVSGYAGGASGTATYEQVSEGDTGHAESVKITYDPAQVSLGQLLQIYFSVAHDPTELNRQGPDSGTQYRSAIFTTTPEQQKVAQAYITQLNGAHAFSDPVVTQLSALQGFYPAEAYHQDYARLHPADGYIANNDAPKVKALAQQFPSLYQATPITTPN